MMVLAAASAIELRKPDTDPYIQHSDFLASCQDSWQAGGNARRSLCTSFLRQVGIRSEVRAHVDPVLAGRRRLWRAREAPQ